MSRVVAVVLTDVHVDGLETSEIVADHSDDLDVVGGEDEFTEGTALDWLELLEPAGHGQRFAEAEDILAVEQEGGFGVEDTADAGDAADAFDGGAIGILGVMVGVVGVVLLIGDNVEAPSRAKEAVEDGHRATVVNDDMISTKDELKDAFSDFGGELKDCRVLPVGIGDLLL